jgi:hypothetical protein
MTITTATTPIQINQGESIQLSTANGENVISITAEDDDFIIRGIEETSHMTIIPEENTTPEQAVAVASGGFDHDLALISDQMKRIRQSIKRLNKGQAMLNALIDESVQNYLKKKGNPHQNYHEWREFWIANEQRIQHLQQEMKVLHIKRAAIYDNKEYQKIAQIRRADKQLKQAERSLKKLGFDIKVSYPTGPCPDCGELPF